MEDRLRVVGLVSQVSHCFVCPACPACPKCFSCPNWFGSPVPPGWDSWDRRVGLVGSD